MENTGFRVIGQDSASPVIGGRELPYVYLDNAASTPPLAGVARKVMEFLPWYASVHRGAGFKSRLATEVFEEARRMAVSFFGYDPGTNVALFGKNATEALNKLAHRWPWQPGDIVISSLAEHHSNDLPWRDKAVAFYVGLRSDGGLDLNHLAWHLARLAPAVKLVALTGASNVTGCLTDIHHAAALAHRHGAKIVVDAAQIAGHRSVRALPDDDPGHIDFLAVSGPKMYAPFGQGVLIGPRDFFARGAPDYTGGGTVAGLTLGAVKWADPPDRDEAGTPNVVGAVAMASAMAELARVGWERILAHERQLTARLYGGLGRIPGVTLYGPPFPGTERTGIASFNVADLPHGLVAAVLACEHAIGVRSGCFCARPYVQRLLGIDEAKASAFMTEPKSQPQTSPGMVRASLGAYNVNADVDRLLEATRMIAAHPSSYASTYEYDCGYWWPKGWRPRYDRYFKLH